MSISTVTSEALQLKLRQLLPSQQGFGTDLSASDTIIPVVDLTASAEGSDVRQDLQTALAFGSQTSFSFVGTSGVIANTPGFYRIFGCSSITAISANTSAQLNLSDGLSNKTIWEHFASTVTNSVTALNLDIVVFLATGESVNAVVANTTSSIIGSVRQIADFNGTLVQPSGFTPQ